MFDFLELFYESTTLYYSLISKKIFTPLLQFNGCWSLIEFLFFFWVNNEFYSSTQVEIKLFQLKEIQILWELLEMQMHHGPFWIQKGAKKILLKCWDFWLILMISQIGACRNALRKFEKSSKLVKNKSHCNLKLPLFFATFWVVKNSPMWKCKSLSTERYIYLLRKDTKVTILCLFVSNVGKQFS